MKKIMHFDGGDSAGTASETSENKTAEQAATTEQVSENNAANAAAPAEENAKEA